MASHCNSSEKVRSCVNNESSAINRCEDDVRDWAKALHTQVDSAVEVALTSVQSRFDEEEVGFAS